MLKQVNGQYLAIPARRWCSENRQNALYLIETGEALFSSPKKKVLWRKFVKENGRRNRTQLSEACLEILDTLLSIQDSLKTEVYEQWAEKILLSPIHRLSIEEAKMGVSFAIKLVPWSTRFFGVWAKLGLSAN